MTKFSGNEDASHEFNMTDSMMYQFRLRHGWAIKGRLKIFRAKYASVVFPNGDVLVIGGVNSLGTPIASTEKYCAATECWELVGDMTMPRYDHTATLLADGRVLVTGGAAQSLAMTTELYEPINKAWRLTALMSTMRRCAHTATLLPRGKVLVIGGVDDEGVVSNNYQIFDPIMESWSVPEKASTGFSYHQATLLNDGQVLITGGYDDFDNLNDSYIYDPISNKWSQPIEMVNKIYSHAAILMHDGMTLVAGGYDMTEYAVKTAQLFDPELNQWCLATDMNQGRVAHHMQRLDDNSIIVVGGVVNSSKSDAVEIYHIPSDTWVLHDVNFIIS